MRLQKYWKVGLRNALRNANPIHPPMADLRRERLHENVFPFTHAGVDYFGSFELEFLRHSLKRWCFTCLTTRALHIRGTQSLDTESCLAAMKRFIAKRGYPNAIISDNGKFVVAANELKAVMLEKNNAKVESDSIYTKLLPIRKSERECTIFALQ